MSEVYHTGAASRFEFALLMAYPVWDVVLVTVACVVMVSAGPGQRPTMTLVTLGGRTSRRSPRSLSLRLAIPSPSARCSARSAKDPRFH